MPVPMIDLGAQYKRIKPEIDAAVAEVFESQGFVGGPKVQALETAVAKFVGSPHAIAVASGTDALLLLLKAIGVKGDDEVITTPFSFFATAGAIANVGARPVFVDIDPGSYNLDVNQVEMAITAKTRAIIPVHLYGQCADMSPIMDTAARHGLNVIEDAAQAFGAKYHGTSATIIGHGAAVSFYPTKNLGGAGDGGMVITRDDVIAERVRMLRAHGADTTYYHRIVGTNSRLDALQAAVLLVKLQYLAQWNEERRARAAYYSERLADVDGVIVPKESHGNYHVWHQYVVRLPKRDEAKRLFQERGIGCSVFYPVPLHLQECFEYLGYGEKDCPEAAQASREVLALPMFAELTDDQQDEVISAIKDHVAAL